MGLALKIKNFVPKDTTALKFTSASLSRTAAAFLAGIIRLKFLSPHDIGFWQSLLILQPYLGFFQLGTNNGLNRELPYLLGLNKEKEAKRFVATGKWVSVFNFYLSVGIALLVLIRGIIIHESWVHIFAYFSIGFYFGLNFMVIHLDGTFRAKHSFSRLANIYFVQSFFLLAGTVLIYFYKFPGYILYQLLLITLLFFQTYRIAPINVRPKFNKAVFKELVKTGFPLFSWEFLQQIPQTFPAIIILFIGGPYLLGIFSPAGAVRTAVVLLPTTYALYIYPQMSYLLGQTNHPKSLWPMVKKILLMTFVVGTIIVAILIYILPFVINHFFSKYSGGIKAAQICCATGVFTAGLAINYALYSLKAHKHLLGLSMIKLASSWVFPWWLGKYMGGGITGVSWGLLISEALCFVVAFCLTYHRIFIYRAALEPTNK